MMNPCITPRKEALVRLKAEAFVGPGSSWATGFDFSCPDYSFKKVKSQVNFLEY